MSLLNTSLEILPAKLSQNLLVFLGIVQKSAKFDSERNVSKKNVTIKIFFWRGEVREG